MGKEHMTTVKDGYGKKVEDCKVYINEYHKPQKFHETNLGKDAQVLTIPTGPLKEVLHGFGLTNPVKVRYISFTLCIIKQRIRVSCYCLNFGQPMSLRV